MWLFFALFSYFLFSAVIIIDKYFLEKPLPNPKVFTFYTAIAGTIFLIFIPFWLEFPGADILILNFAAGGVFIFALFFLYAAFKLDEISKIAASVGSLSAIFIYFLNGLMTTDIKFLTKLDMLGLLFLLLGSIVILFPLNRKVFLAVFAASILYAVFFILAKLVYLSQPFLSGFLWIRIGALFWGLAFLFFGAVRKNLAALKIPKNFSFKHAAFILSIVFIGKLGLGGIANIFQNVAISFASVEQLPLIKGIEGVQYIFILLFALILTKKYPQILKEEAASKFLFQKLAGIVIIMAGAIFLNF